VDAGSIGEALVRGIAAQDAAAIERCFAPRAKLRALTPPGLREREGAGDAAALIAAWFGDATELVLDEVDIDEVGDRLHVSYRFHGIEEGKPFVVQQQLYCTVRDGSVERADLLCSGFRPPRD
jgi:hypothetical protein